MDGVFRIPNQVSLTLKPMDFSILICCHVWVCLAKEEEHPWGIPESFLTSIPTDPGMTNKCLHESGITDSRHSLPPWFPQTCSKGPKGLTNIIYADKPGGGG